LIVEDVRRGESWAWFNGGDETLRQFPAGRLPPSETAYAMTVHRSQGSEFDRILLILPSGQNPIVTRELLYTAVSRARRDVEIWSDPRTIREACSRKVKRHSGLIDRLR
jgi:exodeoxyribonuclease V alpha subunit